MTTALPSSRETASLIVQDVCSGKRTAVEVLETYLDQITSHEGEVNALPSLQNNKQRLMQ